MKKMGAARSLIEIVKKYYLRIVAHHSYWSVKPWSVSASIFLPLPFTPPRLTCLLAVQQTERFRNLAEGLQREISWRSRTGS